VDKLACAGLDPDPNPGDDDSARGRRAVPVTV
jgi:hypothetical protein